MASAKGKGGAEKARGGARKGAVGVSEAKTNDSGSSFGCLIPSWALFERRVGLGLRWIL